MLKLSILSFLSLLWIANDLFFKPIYQNEISGKLSDLLGLIVFPELVNSFFKKNF